jgi:anti-sigma B factor antagonist
MLLVQLAFHQGGIPVVNITSQNEGNVTVIGVSGRVDGLTAPQLDDALQNAIKARHYKIVTDLSGTEFMSSAGMRALLKARLEVQDRNGELRLAGASDYLLDSLKLVGLDKLFHIFPTRQDALKGF